MLPSQRPKFPASIEYAPTSDAQRQRARMNRITKWMFICAVATVTIAGGWRFLKQLQVYLLQRDLMTYLVPDGPMRVTNNANVTNPFKWPASAKLLDIADYRWAYPIFIHERHSSDGASRLVVVCEFAMPGGFTTQLGLLHQSFTPVTFRPGTYLIPGAPGNFPHPAASFHGGQIDPSDQSHFTIRYETVLGNGTIDGWLLDGGKVALEPRDGPFRQH